MVTFILAAGAIPEGFEPDAFFAMYIAGGRGHKPNWLQANGEVVPLPISGHVGVTDLLIFENVPEVGKLVPGLHSQQVGRAFEIVEKEFTAGSPAKDNHMYTINFATREVLEGCVDDGHAGHTCPTCHGLGQVYGD